MTIVLTEPPLKLLAGKKLFGFAAQASMDADADVEAVYRYHASLLVPPRLQWAWMQPTETVFDMDNWDARLAYLIEHDHLGLWHCGVWHNQQPTWLSDALAAISPADPDATKALITEHFEGIHAHTGSNVWPYKYFIAAEEPIDSNVNGFRDTNWLAAYGSELYIDWAFIEARRLWPQLRLVLDVGEDGYGGALGDRVKANLLQYLTDALGRGVPIDVVAIEGHIQWSRTDLGDHSVLSTTALASFVQSIAALGVGVMVSGHDTYSTNDPGLSGPAMDRVSARLSRAYLQTVADNCDLEAIVLWGWADRYESGGEWLIRKGIYDVNMRLKRERYDAVVAGLRA